MLGFLRPLLVLIGIAALAGLLAAAGAEARPGGGGIGSRGARTTMTPPATRTAPTPARPIERSATPAQPGPRTATPAGAAAKPGLFNRPGFMGGMLAGLLGAGLIGLLFGHGLFGNLAGLASLFGLALQFGLIGLAAYFVMRWWRGRAQPALAGVPSGVRPAPVPQPAAKPQPLANASTGYGGGNAPEPGEPSDEIGLKPEDYDTFERLLGEVQDAYSREDVTALRARVTPEMFGYLSEELSDNASRGVVAKLSGVKLLQGDLSEAWAEGPVQYATVALRYEIVDTLVDRNTQKVVEGDPAKAVEAVELWTFTRSAKGGNWLLSAIQQTEDEEQA